MSPVADMSTISNGDLLSAEQRKRKAVRSLETRARGLEGLKVMIEGFEDEMVEKARGALDEAAAILHDAAEELRKPEVQE